MGWSGRAPAPPASEAGKGRQSQGARHVSASRHDDRRNGRRYWEELVPRRRPRSARCHCPAAEVVAWPGRLTAGQHAALPDRDGSLRRGTSSQSQAQGSWPRCPADAGEVRSPVFEGPEERLPRRGGDRRAGATPDDEVRGDEDRRSAQGRDFASWLAGPAVPDIFGRFSPATSLFSLEKPAASPYVLDIRRHAGLITPALPRRIKVLVCGCADLEQPI